MNGVIWSGRISLSTGRLASECQGNHRWLTQGDTSNWYGPSASQTAATAEQHDEPGQETAPGQDERGHCGCDGACPEVVRLGPDMAEIATDAHVHTGACPVVAR